MRKEFALAGALIFGLAGCSAPPPFPWSLAGKTIPPHDIVAKAQVSATDPITYSLSVVVAAAISKDDLTTVSEKIIEDLPAHSLVTIFYYNDPKQVSGEFTVGKAWWGVAGDKNFPAPGDYSHHELKVERK